MNFTKEALKRNYSLKDLTTFKIGGKADLFFVAETKEAMQEAVKYAQAQKLPVLLIGGGSNLVISDQGVEGLVILNSIKNLSKVDLEECTIELSTGFELAELVKLAQNHSLSGAEPFAGIPGTLGGGICGNAGAYGKSLSNILVEAEILTAEGELKKVTPEFFEFDYRFSKLKVSNNYVLSAKFQLAKGDKSEIDAQIEDILAQRHSKHPHKTLGCAGSYFKNLPPAEGETRRRAAGQVLEKVGAKNMSVGGASIFEKHANFIVNKGQAKASDVKELAKLLIAKVKEEYGVELEEEVRYVGRW
jgi:UDP-N-acetylmuramate dehydrogenase